MTTSKEDKDQFVRHYNRTRYGRIEEVSEYWRRTPNR